MVERADEVVDLGVGGQGSDQGRVLVPSAEPFALEADQDADLGGVFGLETGGLEDVGFVTGV